MSRLENMSRHCDRVWWSKISPVLCVDCCSRLRSGAAYSSDGGTRFFIYEQKFCLITAPSLGKRDPTVPRQEMKDKGENGLIAAGGRRKRTSSGCLGGKCREMLVESCFFFFPPIAIRNSCVFLLFCQDFTDSVYLEKLSSFYEPNLNHSLVPCFSHATWSKLNAKICLATSGNALWLDNWPMETSVESLAQQMPVVGFTYSQRKPQFLAIILCMQMEAAPVNMNKCCLSAWFSD